MIGDPYERRYFVHVGLQTPCVVVCNVTQNAATRNVMNISYSRYGVSTELMHRPETLNSDRPVTPLSVATLIVLNELSVNARNERHGSRTGNSTNTRLPRRSSDSTTR